MPGKRARDMPTNQPDDSLQPQSGAALLGTGGERTDGQLLDCFLERREEAAFAALVRRHGPMVLGVCRRVLRHPQDAEDAFQATFLVLIRKAATIGRPELLGNWLYGVAYRTALEARATASRRRMRERQVDPMPEPEAAGDADLCRELQSFLDEELHRLPDKYRIPIVLCDLEGGTRRDVAEQLGLPVGTLSGRLTTGRALLARRLARHGLTLSATALAAALSPSVASAAVPSSLLASTVAAATAGQVTAGVVSAQAIVLAEGVVKAMFLKKLNIAAAVLLALVVVGAAAVVVQADRKANNTGAAKVLDLGTGQRGRRVAWSPDGKTLAVVTKVEKTIFGFQYDRSGSAIRLWDVEKGQMRQTLAEGTDKGVSFGPVVFSADGKTIVAPATEVIRQGKLGEIREMVQVWDAKTLALKQTLKGGLQLVCVALSPDGKLVAAGNPSEKTIPLWNAETGKLERTLAAGETQPWSLAFSPDGKALIVGGQKADHSGQVQWWDARTWKLKHAWKQDEYVNAVAFSANGKLFASGSGGDRVYLWDAQKAELIHSLQGVPHGTRCVAFSPDSKTIAAGWKDGKIRLWDTQTGKLKETLAGHGNEVFSLAFSPDGKTLASTSQDETVRLWPINQPPAGQK